MYNKLHHFYHKLCPECAKFNFEMRSLGQKAGLMSDKYALVTGGRTKIGYEIVLNLLQNGAIVYTTTRFPKDAIEKFA